MALLKSQTVLAISETKFGVVLFRAIDHDETPENRSEHCYRLLEISRVDWTDMGEPKEITITIEPGDKLNSDSPFDEPELQEIDRGVDMLGRVKNDG